MVINDYEQTVRHFTYRDRTISFEELLKIDGSVTIHHRNTMVIQWQSNGNAMVMQW